MAGEAGLSRPPVRIEKPRPEVQVSPKTQEAAKKARGAAEAKLATIAQRGKVDRPDKVLAEIAGEKEPLARVGLSVDLSDAGKAKVEALRDESRVGTKQYGESLVNKHQKGKNTPAEHEDAQALAYTDLQQKIDAGVVDPSVIPTEVCLTLGVTPELGEIPQTYEGIADKVGQELRTFKEKGMMTEDELATVTREMTTFANLYGEAYGKGDVASAYELTRDNARKLVYQHMRDKQVFSGSDHGFRHIVDGNIRFADQMVASLREKGIVVSAKDQVILHQAMYDHDLGYTTGAAQAPKGFDASKDHPLVSARLIEDNKAYYVDKFGEDGYRAIFDSVLNHSYPRLEYQSDGQEVVHAGLIRGISSTVDSLGVTVETKTPEFFWNKDAMRTLLKIRLAQETMGGKVPEELMGQYRQELMVVADTEPDAVRRNGYRNAIGSFFNEVTAENTLGHYTGVVRSVQVEEVPSDGESHEEGHEGHEGEDKRFRVVVEMTPTEVYAALGNMFGDKLAAQSFVKAIKDLGLDASRLEAHARGVRQAKSRGESHDVLDVVSDQAHVRVGNNFLEDSTNPEVADTQKIQAIAEVFHEVEMLSARTEINGLLDAIAERGSEAIPEIQARFEREISDKTTESELGELNNLLINLSDQSLSGEKDVAGNGLTVSEVARGKLKTFQTAQEKAFLGIS